MTANRMPLDEVMAYFCWAAAEWEDFEDEPIRFERLYRQVEREQWVGRGKWEPILWDW